MQHQTQILVAQSRPGLADILNFLKVADKLHAEHPDLLIIDQPENKASIGIDQARQLIEWSTKQPFAGEIKAAIIFSAYSITPEAQNSLLKLLEEPEPNTLICLITNRPDALLATVRSRALISYLPATEVPPVDVPEISLAQEFNKTNLITQMEIIEKIASNSSREGVKAFVMELIRIQMQKSEKRERSKADIDMVELLQKAIVGINAGTNIKLTLQTIAITMNTL